MSTSEQEKSDEFDLAEQGVLSAGRGDGVSALFCTISEDQRVVLVGSGKTMGRVTPDEAQSLARTLIVTGHQEGWLDFSALLAAQYIRDCAGVVAGEVSKDRIQKKWDDAPMDDPYAIDRSDVDELVDKHQINVPPSESME